MVDACQHAFLADTGNTDDIVDCMQAEQSYLPWSFDFLLHMSVEMHGFHDNFIYLFISGS